MAETIGSVIGFILLVAFIISIGKVADKGGHEWWEAYIPIYNIVVFVDIATGDTDGIFCLLIPVFNIFYLGYLCIEFAASFGMDWWFGIGLLIFPCIFFPILAFVPSIECI